MSFPTQILSYIYWLLILMNESKNFYSADNKFGLVDIGSVYSW